MVALTLPSTFTEAHRRALEWLPEDGDWRNESDVVAEGLHGLSFEHPDLVEIDMSRAHWWRWRFTPAGIELIGKAKGK